ncbi:MAG: TetR/AcrR family transcriptional regulator [Nannocystales bacterium]
MPADTKAKLLESAERLVRERGYNGFSYADLAAEIGIRTASIHYHFRAKSDLALALIERYTERIGAGLAELSETGHTGADRIAGYVGVYRNALRQGNSLCLCVSLSADAESLEPAALAALEAFHRAGVAWLTKAYALAAKDGSIGHVSDPGSEASATLAVVEGAQLVGRASRSVEPFDDAVALLLGRLRDVE